MPEAGLGDVDRAVRAAHRAFHAPVWSGLTASARGRLLLRLADLVQAAAPRLARLETRDTGEILRQPSAQFDLRGLAPPCGAACQGRPA
ncbi:aldehyde dehydrogenase family protein [Rubellimicrobium aerolatum]|uniref:Aldehyde dehydrogenase family protein n=1 Tax=Rubellimicrobium aerolatum TaxID=490979 RepID=A0ABW0SE47_9RHOB|nr:acyl-CoA reductase-like NAD-dependent aldehyde dehydrogenase [Rubellimicrobium aerolatum]